MRDSFIFYRSYFEATKPLSQDQKAQLYDAICLYSLEQESTDLDPICTAMFSLIKPQIEANYKRFLNGKKGAVSGKLGGRPKTPNKPLDNPKLTPNVNVNVNVNDNVNVNQKEILNIYNDFCRNKFGAPAKINGMEVKAMKSIVTYLKKVCKSKGDDSDQQIIKSWSFILSGWDKLEPFLQKQIKLSQINSNLTNIINQLKNGDKKKSSSIADEILSKYN
tara:strand:+ start:2066 stop:2725 length:660 start_codon:yes stop_codon:yes gene_type:complete